MEKEGRGEGENVEGREGEDKKNFRCNDSELDLSQERITNFTQGGVETAPYLSVHARVR